MPVSNDLKLTPLKNKLYKVLSLTQVDISQGEGQFLAFKKEDLSEMAGEWSYKLLTQNNGQHLFSYENKVILINIIAHGSASIRKKIMQEFANQSSTQCGSFYKLGIFDLFYTWMINVKNKQLNEIFDSAILQYINDERAWCYYKEHRHEQVFRCQVEACLHKSYLSILQHRTKYMTMWKEIREHESGWENEIKCSLGLDLSRCEQTFPDHECFSLHEVENPWNYTDKTIQELRSNGIDIRLNGEIGDHYYHAKSELLVQLTLNGINLEEWFAGPFVCDPSREKLYCSMEDDYSGLNLVEIDLKNNQIFRIDSRQEVPMAYCHDGNKLEAYDCWHNQNLGLSVGHALFYTIPELFKSNTFKQSLEKLRSCQLYDFKMEEPLLSVSRWSNSFPERYEQCYILGTFHAIPRGYPSQICLDILTGKVVALCYEKADSKFYQFEVAQCLSEFVELIHLYQEHLQELEISHSTDYAIHTISSSQAAQLSHKLLSIQICDKDRQKQKETSVRSKPISEHTLDSKQSDFWLWLLNPIISNAK